MRYPILTLAACALFSLPSVHAGDPPSTAIPAGEKEVTEHHQLGHAARVIKAAIESLEKAKHDFGGHREAALKDCRLAEKQLQEAHEFDLKHDHDGKEGSAAASEKEPAKKLTAVPDGKAHELGEHSRIAHAISELDRAIEYLQKAPHDFGGHRTDAVRDCQAAKKQLEEALTFAEKSEKK